MQGTLFLYSFPVRLLNFKPDGIVKIRNQELLQLRCNHAGVIVQYRVFKCEKRAEWTLQPYPFDGDLNRIDPDSPSFGSSTASVLRVKHGKDKGFEKKTTRQTVVVGIKMALQQIFIA